MVFPVSGVEVNPLILPLIALVVSTFTSRGGVSGAFLLLPFQMSSLNFCLSANSILTRECDHLFNLHGALHAIS